MENKKINRVLGYRKMLNLTQSDIAEILNISTQAYGQKENLKISFKDSEKVLLLNIFKEVDPELNIDSLFF